MNPKIDDTLVKIERQHDVKILYACEAGSRVWNWDRVDGSSDYDLRFIYVDRLARYFSIAKNKKTSINYVENQDIDCQGLELGHALHLLVRSNPNLLEQVYSPIVYRSQILAQLKTIAAEHYRTVAAWNHYGSLARGNYRDFLRTHSHVSDGFKPLKKLMVVIRALLLMKAAADRGIDFTNYIGKNGIYELATEYMQGREKIAFHMCVLALRGVTERALDMELVMSEWGCECVNENDDMKAPEVMKPNGSRTDHSEVNKFLMETVLKQG